MYRVICKKRKRAHPRTNGCQCHCPVWEKTEAMMAGRPASWVKWGRPRNPLSWPRQTAVAQPPMKPTMAACERKSTRKPRRSRPIAAWKAPAKKVAVKARRVYISGCAAGAAAGPSMEAKSSEPTAMVPTARSRELPRTVYTSAGTKLESAVQIDGQSDSHDYIQFMMQCK